MKEKVLSLTEPDNWWLRWRTPLCHPIRGENKQVRLLIRDVDPNKILIDLGMRKGQVGGNGQMHRMRNMNYWVNVDFRGGGGHCASVIHRTADCHLKRGTHTHARARTNTNMNTHTHTSLLIAFQKLYNWGEERI